MDTNKMARVLELLRDERRPTYKEIATETGVAVRTISFWVRRMKAEGIEIPPRRIGAKKLDFSSLK